MQSTAQLDFKLWDLSTVTAADFTVELVITKSMWKEHLESKNYLEELRPSYAAPSLTEMGNTAAPALQARIEIDLKKKLNNPIALKDN